MTFTLPLVNITKLSDHSIAAFIKAEKIQQMLGAKYKLTAEYYGHELLCFLLGLPIYPTVL